MEWKPLVALRVFDHVGEAEVAEAPGGPVDDLGISVGDPEDAAAVAALGIEDPRKKPFRPVPESLGRGQAIRLVIAVTRHVPECGWP